MNAHQDITVQKVHLLQINVHQVHSERKREVNHQLIVFNALQILLMIFLDRFRVPSVEEAPLEILKPTLKTVSVRVNSANGVSQTTSVSVRSVIMNQAFQLSLKKSQQIVRIVSQKQKNNVFLELITIRTSRLA